MRVLDLGCGWGGFGAYAAERHGVEVVGITVSREQVRFAKQCYAHLPVDIRLDDYRNVTGSYDAVVSLGLIEHVGPKDYRATWSSSIAASRRAAWRSCTRSAATEPPRQINRFHEYIFPNAALPSLAQLVTAMEHIFIADP